MCAYNRVNGEPACANDFLLQDQLRGDWKFNGYVVSDCDAIVDIYRDTTSRKPRQRLLQPALKKGMDNECADFFTETKDNSDYVKYLDAVKQGLLQREGHRRRGETAFYRAHAAGNVRSSG